MLLTTPLVVTVGISMTIPLSLIGQIVLSSQYSTAWYWLGAFVVLLSFVFINHETKENVEPDGISWIKYMGSAAIHYGIWSWWRRSLVIWFGLRMCGSWGKQLRRLIYPIELLIARQLMNALYDIKAPLSETTLFLFLPLCLQIQWAVTIWVFGRRLATYILLNLKRMLAHTFLVKEQILYLSSISLIVWPKSSTYRMVYPLEMYLIQSHGVSVPLHYSSFLSSAPHKFS